MQTTDESATYAAQPPLLAAIPADAVTVHGSVMSTFGPGYFEAGEYPDRRAFWRTRRAYRELYSYALHAAGRRTELHLSSEGLDAFPAVATASVMRSLTDRQRLKILAATGVNHLLVPRALDPAVGATAVEVAVGEGRPPMRVYRLENAIADAQMVGSVRYAPHMNAGIEAVLLLDEPTNHLDLEMLEWLEGWLNRFRGAALIVSHDRAFLDNTVTSILELDPATQHNYQILSGELCGLPRTENVRAREAGPGLAGPAGRDRPASLCGSPHTRPHQNEERWQGRRRSDKFAKGFFGNRATKNVAGRAKHIEARIEKLLNEDRIEKPKQNWQMKLDFGAPAHQSRDVLITEKLAVGYDRPLLTDLNLNIRAGQRIALTGPNGTGKTTKIEKIKIFTTSCSL